MFTTFTYEIKILTLNHRWLRKIIRLCNTPNSAHGVKRGCHFFFIYKLINFKFVHSYNVKHFTCNIFRSSGLQNIYKLHIWKCSTFTIFTLLTKETKRLLHIQNRPKVFRWASNYVLTLEADVDCLAFCFLLLYLHG